MLAIHNNRFKHYLLPSFTWNYKDLKQTDILLRI